MSETIQEKSCGIIIYRTRDGLREYLILHYEKGHFDFPKGHVEEGEDEKGTALRELKEETGILHVEFQEGFREHISYLRERDDKKYHKDVYFYLAEVDADKITLSNEHKGFEWLTFCDALETVTYDNAKELLRKADEFLTME